MYTSSDARRDFKKLLDEAWLGDPVTIRRGEQTFVLRKMEQDKFIAATNKKLHDLEMRVSALESTPRVPGLMRNGPVAPNTPTYDNTPNWGA